MDSRLFKISLLLYFLTKTTGMVININASYFCWIPDENLSQTHHVCDRNYYYQPTDEFELNENYNETHVWFDVDHRLCTAKLNDVIQIAICEENKSAAGCGHVTLPPRCGRDIYGNPIKCNNQFN
nr:uncharacterized protein LOC111423814 [Onthophagus taurus]